LQEGSVRLPLWQWRHPWPTEIDAQTAFLLSGERKRIAWREIMWVWRVWQNGACFASSS
jgi:hypothetical protein